jgi:formylglycine-generating enzyme required for sulfatase activity
MECNMVALPHPFTPISTSTLLPAGLLIVGLALLWMELGFPGPIGASVVLAGPEVVTIEPADFSYRLDGSFLRNGQPVDAPMLQTRLAEPLNIMKFLVSQSDYARCVLQGFCQPAAPQNIGKGNIAVTGVNFNDASRYADWLSQQTGQIWTLPTDQEWAFAAGEKRPDEALVDSDSTNPALRWLADYDIETRRKSSVGRTLLPLGSFGDNENGLTDIAANVWEWTQTCHRRVVVDSSGAITSQMPSCTIHVLDGQHRAPMNNFVRDAKSGGCSVGVPPANFGFRLVRRPGWTERLLALLHM